MCIRPASRTVAERFREREAPIPAQKSRSASWTYGAGTSRQVVKLGVRLPNQFSPVPARRKLIQRALGSRWKGIPYAQLY